MKSGKADRRRLTERDRDILEHIGRYRLSFKEIVERIYFRRVDSKDVLEALRKANYISTVKGYGGNRRGLALTPKAVDELGLESSKCEKLGSKKAEDAILVLAFCCLAGKRRISLEIDELTELFGKDDLPEGTYHCLETTEDGIRLHNMFTPGPKTNARSIAKDIVDRVISGEKRSAVKQWIASGLYCYTVLIPGSGGNNRRETRINNAIDKTTDKSGRPLRELSPVLVEQVAGIPGLKEALSVLSQEDPHDRPVNNEGLPEGTPDPDDG